MPLLDMPDYVRLEVEAKLHLAIVCLKASWDAISELELILDGETVGTAESKAAMQNLDAAVSALATDVEAGKVYTITIEDLEREMVTSREVVDAG